MSLVFNWAAFENIKFEYINRHNKLKKGDIFKSKFVFNLFFYIKILGNLFIFKVIIVLHVLLAISCCSYFVVFSIQVLLFTFGLLGHRFPMQYTVKWGHPKAKSKQQK